MPLVIPTPPGDVAFCIALGVLLLSVVLQPIVTAFLHRFRANRAWRSIEKNERVDVTKYNIFSEALGDRGRWDTARIVTIMIAAFHVSTWGLELTLDLALRTDGPAVVLNLPPPVYARNYSTASNLDLYDWIVKSYSYTVDEGGTLGNFEGTVTEGSATTSYFIGGSSINGGKTFASWSTTPSHLATSSLFYAKGDGHSSVNGTTCTKPCRSVYLFLDKGDEENTSWGMVTECESGPMSMNSSIEAPPTILLSGKDGSSYLIVEEEGSYPSFLYSVWKLGEATTDSHSTDLSHVFYISAIARLAEAIVTAVVNGIFSGGGCVDLVSKYSSSTTSASDTLTDHLRVAPFGEHPTVSSVDRLDDVEHLVRGVQVSSMGVVCGLLLIGVTAASFVGYICSVSHRPFDVYDRDAVIRAVALPDGEGRSFTSPGLKIFVRRVDDERFRMMISDDPVNRWWETLRRRFYRDVDESPPEMESPAPRLSRAWTLPSSRQVVPHAADLAALIDARQEQRCVKSRATAFVELIASTVPSAAQKSPDLEGVTTTVLLDASPISRSKRDAGKLATSNISNIIVGAGSQVGANAAAVDAVRIVEEPSCSERGPCNGTKEPVDMVETEPTGNDANMEEPTDVSAEVPVEVGVELVSLYCDPGS